MAAGSFLLKGSSFRQWVAAVRGYGVAHPEEAGYWKSQLEGESFYVSHAARSLSTQSVFELDESLTGLLLHKAPGVVPYGDQ